MYDFTKIQTTTGSGEATTTCLIAALLKRLNVIPDLCLHDL